MKTYFLIISPVFICTGISYLAASADMTSWWWFALGLFVCGVLLCTPLLVKLTSNNTHEEVEIPGFEMKVPLAGVEAYDNGNSATFIDTYTGNLYEIRKDKNGFYRLQGGKKIYSPNRITMSDGHWQLQSLERQIRKDRGQ